MTERIVRLNDEQAKKHFVEKRLNEIVSELDGVILAIDENGLTSSEVSARYSDYDVEVLLPLRTQHELVFVDDVLSTKYQRAVEKARTLRELIRQKNDELERKRRESEQNQPDQEIAV